jgi:hypothetical protein
MVSRHQSFVFALSVVKNSVELIGKRRRVVMAVWDFPPGARTMMNHAWKLGKTDT